MCACVRVSACARAWLCVCMRVPTRRVPLEIRVQGEKEPIYEFSLEDLGRSNEQPVLPFNAYGTLAWARNEFENNSASSQVRDTHTHTYRRARASAHTQDPGKIGRRIWEVKLCVCMCVCVCLCVCLQVFFLLKDSELTPVGANLLDGRFAVFGYVVQGQDALGFMKVCVTHIHTHVHTHTHTHTQHTHTHTHEF